MPTKIGLICRQDPPTLFISSDFGYLPICRLSSCHKFLLRFFIFYFHKQEDIEMVKKNSKHSLVGFVDLGTIHDDMQILSGIVLHTTKYKLKICF